MKVRGTVDFDVEISKDEAKRIAVKLIEEARNWWPGYVIFKGNLCTVKTYTTSHSWDEMTIVRIATEEDTFTYKLIQDILKG
jgi:hypothetical protein